ncbi:MAG: DNA polymerase III subunit gamma/tau [Elusimicrobia bacterium]|nr:DNA polymerase III subunit gamma/tau [Elusimicrobiota bacterium]
MSYLVLARKYRPQSFDDLVGQGHVAKTLVNAIAGQRIAHAYVLSGPRGCGKTTTARILARALNCVQGPTATPCGECPQCVEIANGSSTDDVLEIDGASNRGIDQIRELRETVKYAPARSRYRIIIIDEAHQISKDGFNALLKTLEEPPPHVVFMMATTESQKIPETILSRCQRFQLRSITLTDIFDRIKRIVDAEKIPIQEAALREVARSAHGSLRDALSLLDQVIAFAPGGATIEDVRNLLGLLPGEFVRSFTETIQSGDPAGVLRAVQTAIEDGLDLSQLAEDLLDRRHRLLLWKAGVRDPRAPDAAEMEKESGAISAERLERDLAVLSRAVADLRRSECPRVTFELACLEIAQDAVSVNELVERLEILEKALRSNPPIIAPPLAPPAKDIRSSAPALSPVLQKPPSTPAGGPERPPSAPAVSGPWGPERVRSAWTTMVNEVGHKKPSLETFLHMARWSALPGNVLKLAFDQEFQKNQVVAQEALWMDLLRQKIPMGFTVQYAIETPAPPPLSATAKISAPPPPAPPADEDETMIDHPPEENEPPAGPVSEGEEESPETAAAVDPGVRKILEKFPGRVRRVDTVK